jgi:hypothetical protein
MRKRALGVTIDVTDKTNFALEPLLFSWPIPEGGFQWQRLIESPFLGAPKDSFSDALVCRSPESSEIHYNPMDEPSLFLRFAQCPPTKEGILLFANQYGLLNGRTTFVRSTVARSRGIFGDTLSEWVEEIKSMSEAVDLWQALEARDHDLSGLRKHIQWLPNVVMWQRRPGGKTIIKRRRDPPYADWTDGDLITPAFVFLAEEINRGVGVRVAPRLTVDVVGKIRRSLRPLNLAGVLWYQFYSAFTGETRLGLCADCGNPMVYIRATRRMHPWCGNKKRQARFKENQRNGKTRTE